MMHRRLGWPHDPANSVPRRSDRTDTLHQRIAYQVTGNEGQQHRSRADSCRMHLSGSALPIE